MNCLWVTTPKSFTSEQPLETQKLASFYFFLEIGFNVPMNEVEFLKKRLAEEEAKAERANEARREAEARFRLAERERDVYKVLARTLRSRLSEGSVRSSEVMEESATEMLLGGRETFLSFSLGQVLRLLSRERDDEEMEEGEEEDDDFLEDDDDDDDEMSDAMDDSDDEEEGSYDESLVAASEDENLTPNVNVSISSGIRSHRTVSISQGDL